MKKINNNKCMCYRHEIKNNLFRLVLLIPMVFIDKGTNKRKLFSVYIGAKIHSSTYE